MSEILVFGGAGFTGCNAASRKMAAGASVAVFDNLSRKGSRENMDWLRGQGAVELTVGDVRRQDDVAGFFRGHRDARTILHLAGQVAVTTSVLNPREDFETNALGTLNILEAMREHLPDAVLIYSSTNKVYGGMEHIGITLREDRYGYERLPEGVNEEANLDFHSPYGCSKGCADQYVRDYSRIYGLKTVVLRQSCIYGYRQFGIEDQGWVAWFTIAAAMGRPITIYGDGKQIRDILFIDDLLDAFDVAIEVARNEPGQIFNIGGGISNTISLLELIAHLESLTGRPMDRTFADWRPGDQRVYVSDIRQARERLEWSPRISPKEGVGKLYEWVSKNKQVFQDLDLC